MSYALLKKVVDAVRKEQIFDQHVITREREGVWHCGIPHDSNMSFRVVSTPGAIIIYGDLGELIFLPNTRNALWWAYKTKWDPENPYYPLTKISPQLRDKIFVVEEIDAHIEERLKDSYEAEDKDEEYRWLRIREKWDDFPDRDNQTYAEQYWYQLCNEENEDDPIDGMNWTSRVLWIYQAMCWFMSHVDPRDERFRAELLAE